MNLNSILLYVSDIHKTRDFYEKLGLVLESEQEEYLRFIAGSISLQCMTKASVPELTRSDLDLETKKSFYIYIQVENVDETFLNVKKQGLSPSSEPHDWPWGWREFAIKDPDGYVIVFYTPIIVV